MLAEQAVPKQRMQGQREKAGLHPPQVLLTALGITAATVASSSSWPPPPPSTSRAQVLPALFSHLCAVCCSATQTQLPSQHAFAITWRCSALNDRQKVCTRSFSLSSLILPADRPGHLNWGSVGVLTPFGTRYLGRKYRECAWDAELISWCCANVAAAQAGSCMWRALCS